ncbi:rRNA maturation RNase YbeY [Synechococcus sp. CCY9201]|uniref:rRNA maturation RNase YbeY n=1 Tax=unclassified Synechococcus TaxID=2626047 RepID=UPI002B1EB656|nr:MULTISPECIES: rRNA maturation RNase YbeY [unclassified Synechococcus]MEA5421885.1 rRNA maturation RNase YbeY [Synechococcus sp. CCY9202]MEA5472921.1 rRNA maturation RNase YbeY [Synechococcus sp. CCY9201]
MPADSTIEIDPNEIDLDLAFQADDSLEAALLAAAAPLADVVAGLEPWSEHLGRWLAELRPELPGTLQATAYSLGLSLCSDAAIAELNASWRQKNGATDVLAFAAQETAEGEQFPDLPMAAGMELEALELGDIVISLETAARQAGDAGNTLEDELLFLASHGLLHLLGWDHPDEPSLAAMLALQERLIRTGQAENRR